MQSLNDLTKGASWKDKYFSSSNYEVFGIELRYLRNWKEEVRLACVNSSLCLPWES